MTDFKEEQSNELEALESIYPDELQIVSTEPFHCFRIAITSQCDGDVEDATCILQFTYTAEYPDEAPIIEVLSCDDLDEDVSDAILNVMKNEIEESLGMAMVFTLVSAAQEKLTELVENAARSIIEEKERVIRLAEEAEKKRLEGTRVTVESFIIWKEKFDAERLEIKKKQGALQKENLKLTGRELFMQDHTLDDSDMKFLEEDPEASVAVDESLFQDMDDLDIGDLDTEDFGDDS